MIYVFEEDATDNKPPVALPLIKFDCFKSYEESTAYLLGENAVHFSLLYHYATLHFQDDFLPKLSEDGNYYEIPEPMNSFCGDVWSASTDIQINDHELKARVENIVQKNDSLLTDQFLLNLGFIPVNMSMIYGKGIEVTKLR